MKGTFTKENLEAFVGPLKSLADVMGDEGVVLNVLAKEKTVQVFALNNSAGTLVYVKYDPKLFEGFEFADEDEKIGVLKVGDLVRYFSVLDESGVQLSFLDKTLAISHEAGNLSFKTADPDMIQEAPKTFKGATWLAEVDVDSKFSKLNKAMGVLAGEDCVFVTGSSSKGKIVLNVRSGNVEMNSFKLEVVAPVTNDFETAYRKDILQLVFRTPAESIKVSFSERLARFECANTLCSLTYFVAKKSAAK